MMSLWSPRMSRGPDTARVTMLNTIGSAPRTGRELLEGEQQSVRRRGVEHAPPPCSRRSRSRRAVLPVARDHPDGVLSSAFIASRVSATSVEGVMGSTHDVVVDLLGRRRRDLVAALHDHRLGGRPLVFFASAPFAFSLWFRKNRYFRNLCLTVILSMSCSASLAEPVRRTCRCRCTGGTLAVLVVDPSRTIPSLPVLGSFPFSTRSSNRAGDVALAAPGALVEEEEGIIPVRLVESP